MKKGRGTEEVKKREWVTPEPTGSSRCGGCLKREKGGRVLEGCMI